MSAKLSDEEKLDKAIRDLQFENPGPQNLVDFDCWRDGPRRSGRLRNSVLPVGAGRTPKSEPMHDKEGKIEGKDLCDCLNLQCPGCFSACDKCGLSKCSTECRVNRKWTFHSSTVDGKIVIVKNPVLKEK